MAKIMDALTIAKINQIEDIISEAARFVRKANLWRDRLTEDSYCVLTGCKESSAAKRASMDLSRILTELRRPG